MKAIKFDHIIEIEEVELADGTIIMRQKEDTAKALVSCQRSMLRSKAVGLGHVANKYDLKVAEARAMAMGVIGAY